MVCSVMQHAATPVSGSMPGHARARLGQVGMQLGQLLVSQQDLAAQVLRNLIVISQRLLQLR